MAKKPNTKGKVKAPEERLPNTIPVNERGKEHQALRLTGKRAQKGTKYTYEVVWAPGSNGKDFPKSWEPASCLIGWEKEMNKVDAQIDKRAKEAPMNVAQSGTQPNGGRRIAT